MKLGHVVSFLSIPSTFDLEQRRKSYGDFSDEGSCCRPDLEGGL